MTFLLTVRNDMGPDPVQQGEAMKHYSAVCFDFDYTLGDSTDSIVAGFQYGFERLGHPIPDRETVRGTIGYLLEDAYTMLTGDRDPERLARFRAYFLEVAKPRQRKETFLFPGAAELLQGLRAQGVRLGIVSTKTGETIEYIMDRLGLPPERVLYCGDTVLDAEAAQRAGLEFAAVLNGTTPASAFDVWPHVFLAQDLDALARFLEGRTRPAV